MTKRVKDITWVNNQYGSASASNPENLKNIKTLLDDTGPGFCLAKFTQGTLHLGTGMTHACHHPSPHKIPLDEIQKDPAALFNTSVLKNARREMLSGTRPKECDYCWRMEDNGSPSDRLFKSIDTWALDTHDRIVDSDPNENYYPTYLEVDFSNVCNFKCTYCGPEFSSTWVNDLKHNGPIKLLQGTSQERWAQGWQNLDDIAYKNREHNPYVDAFWKWFPEAYKHLKVYRITGGEPLLSKETFRSIDWLIENPNPELEFNINSNLSSPQKLWDQFIDKITTLVQGNHVKRFTMFTSVDAWGKRAEYIRTGLDFELFQKRYEQLLSIGNIRCVIMCTFNIFSITSIKDLMEWHVGLKRKYNCDPSVLMLENDTGFKIGPDTSHQERNEINGSHYSIVGIDFPYLRHPEYLDAKLATGELVQEYLIPAMNYISNNAFLNTWGQHQGFEESEVEKFKRITIDSLYQFKNQKAELENPHSDLNKDRAMFYDFVNEKDKRDNTNFCETFPEMVEFYNMCKLTKQALVEKI
jgi:organic radical activating enzyme